MAARLAKITVGGVSRVIDLARSYVPGGSPGFGTAPFGTAPFGV